VSNKNGTGRGRTAVFNVTSEGSPNESVDVTITSADANVIDVTVDETRLHIEVQHLDYGIDQRSVPSRLHCMVDGVPREFSICRTADGSLHVLADGYAARFEVRAGSKRPSVMHESKRTGSSSPLIVAPMPATVLEILVDVGDHVRVDDPMIRVEAMKMITTLNAPVDGIVRDITVTENQTVRAGERLIRIEPMPDSDAAVLKIA
jgi:biotin carboxyl carrier protein